MSAHPKVCREPPNPDHHLFKVASSSHAAGGRGGASRSSFILSFIFC